MAKIPYRSLCVALALSMGACATVNEPGWTGSGAMAFDTAEGLCRSRAREVRRPEAREAAFLVCMSEHGWTRGPARDPQ